MAKITHFLIFLFVSLQAFSQMQQITHDAKNKTVRITDQSADLCLYIDYSNGCKISKAEIKSDNKLAPEGVFTSVLTEKDNFNSSNLLNEATLKLSKNKVEISNIRYGNDEFGIHEVWTLTPESDHVNWKITRDYPTDAIVQDISFPVWNFKDMQVWKGGIMDNGGMVWCKYLGSINDTYGVHTGGVTFWNPDNGHGLRITPKVGENKEIAAKYTHTPTDQFAYNLYVTDTELKQQHNQSRFVYGHNNVFTPFAVSKGKQEIELDIQYIDYPKEYSRGTLPGINAEAVRELMNTTGRYGVVYRNIIGGNGWTTNWKCLHEPFFAQIGLALNDNNYTNNLASTLDQERDMAITKEGRVLSRWHDVDGDEIPGTYNYETGYYEAKWGYTIDSQTGYIINTTELFDLTGDVDWLKSHKESCEKALNWLIGRDENKNGIFEMMNNNISEQTASDWTDIVWASYENAFVNAQMYQSLRLWGDCEKILGDTKNAVYYHKVADKLKEAFNKNVDEGGFWLPEKNQYIYWRDKDGSIHGDNFFTPLCFAVIAFDICDDKHRKASLLNQVEELMKKENLFHWPLCFESFKREEVHGNNWPFPKYENGDIFPTWGYLAIKAYAGYDKEIALKYIHNILDQYLVDGLSSQRYSRTTQKGLGDDILAGICTTVTALYKDIYGITPKWNRLGIEPHMTEQLNGTNFNYTLRNTDYRIRLQVDNYELSSKDFTVQCNSAFGAEIKENTLFFFPDNQEETVLSLERKSSAPIKIDVRKSNKGLLNWTIDSKDTYTFSVNRNLTGYQLLVNGTEVNIKNETDAAHFKYKVTKPTEFQLIKK